MPDAPQPLAAPKPRRGDKIRYLLAGALIWWGVFHQLTVEKAEPPTRPTALAGCRMR